MLLILLSVRGNPRCSSNGHAAIAQLVERIHGKDEVSGSNPDRGSKTDLKPAPENSAGFFVHNAPRLLCQLYGFMNL